MRMCCVKPSVEQGAFSSVSPEMQSLLQRTLRPSSCCSAHKWAHCNEIFSLVRAQPRSALEQQHAPPRTRRCSSSSNPLAGEYLGREQDEEQEAAATTLRAPMSSVPTQGPAGGAETTYKVRGGSAANAPPAPPLRRRRSPYAKGQ